jgi:hypothetical protein
MAEGHGHPLVKNKDNIGKKKSWLKQVRSIKGICSICKCIWRV